MSFGLGPASVLCPVSLRRWQLKTSALGSGSEREKKKGKGRSE